jgi:lysophospholipase L1-like esterase
VAATATRVAAGPFELRDGDRVVLVGSTMIERDQSYGYLETVLTSRYPDRTITFRNLGWSGDNVFGAARARFGPVAEGFRHLKEHLEVLKPTVVILAYGTNESFEGQAGISTFLEGLNTLLDVVRSTGARVVLLSPAKQEDLGRPLPDPARHNADVKLYVDALRAVARQKGYPFVDLFDAFPARGSSAGWEPLTDDGLHWTELGYWRTAGLIATELGTVPREWIVELDANGKPSSVKGTTLSHVEKLPEGIRFVATDDVLPMPPPPRGRRPRSLAVGSPRTLTVQGLAPGRYVVKVDGEAVERFSAGDKPAELEITRGPEFEHVDTLRATINAKNLLYFHRWRPQNETYLFGFRKYEQGQNAREIPLFDPLVAKKEDEIARLRRPVSHTYEVVLDKEAGR